MCQECGQKRISTSGFSGLLEQKLDCGGLKNNWAAKNCSSLGFLLLLLLFYVGITFSAKNAEKIAE